MSRPDTAQIYLCTLYISSAIMTA